MPAMPKPSLTEITQGLIDHLIAHLDFINQAVAPYGVSLEAVLSEKDDGEYQRIKFGDRTSLEDGLSIHFVPLPIQRAWFATGSSDPPGGIVEDQIKVGIAAFWKNSAKQHLLGTPGKAFRALTTLTEALMALYAPSQMESADAAWQVDPSDSDSVVQDPMIRQAEPVSLAYVAEGGSERRHQELPFVALEFSCTRRIGGP
jgi:hypothetical protein